MVSSSISPTPSPISNEEMHLSGGQRHGSAGETPPFLACAGRALRKSSFLVPFQYSLSVTKASFITILSGGRQATESKITAYLPLEPVKSMATLLRGTLGLLQTSVWPPGLISNWHVHHALVGCFLMRFSGDFGHRWLSLPCYGDIHAFSSQGRQFQTHYPDSRGHLIQGGYADGKIHRKYELKKNSRGHLFHSSVIGRETEAHEVSFAQGHRACLLSTRLGSFIHGNPTGRVITWTRRLWAGGSCHCSQNLLLFAETLMVKHGLHHSWLLTNRLLDLQLVCLCGLTSLISLWQSHQCGLERLCSGATCGNFRQT